MQPEYRSVSAAWRSTSAASSAPRCRSRGQGEHGHGRGAGAGAGRGVRHRPTAASARSRSSCPIGAEQGTNVRLDHGRLRRRRATRRSIVDQRGHRGRPPAGRRPAGNPNLRMKRRPCRPHADRRGPRDGRARRAAAAGPHRDDRCQVQLHAPRRAGRDRRVLLARGSANEERVSPASLTAAPHARCARDPRPPLQPLRRDPASGYIGGVCAGFAARLGIDPILIRIGFVLTLLAGGAGIPLYAIGWALIPAEGPERPVVARLLTRRDTLAGRGRYRPA